jgi:hypothetical protein
MQIKPERLQAFKELYKEEFGIELSDSEAHSKANLLVNYALLSLKPLRKEVEEVTE